jgi:glycosyltransferase involved in cell wall biosynthesis
MARHLGHSVSIFSASEQIDLTALDLIHLAPGDLSMLGLARELKARDIPFVVSPILDKIYKNFALRVVTLGDRIMGRLYRSHIGGTKEICHLASGVCLMSTHEGERILRGLGLTHKVMRVIQPAGLCEPLLADSSLFRQRYGLNEFLLFAGDLGNPRKNVLRLIQAASLKKLPVVLVGPCSNTGYGQQVRRLIDRARDIHYFGVVPRDVLLSAMINCRVFALPSLMEGIGLAAVEAGMLGARVLITKNGGPRDYFGDMAWYVDPYSIKSIAHGLDQAWNASNTPPTAKFLQEKLSMSELAPKLEKFYQDTLQTNIDK